MVFRGFFTYWWSPHLDTNFVVLQGLHLRQVAFGICDRADPWIQLTHGGFIFQVPVTLQLQPCFCSWKPPAYNLLHPYQKKHVKKNNIWTSGKRGCLNPRPCHLRPECLVLGRVTFLALDFWCTLPLMIHPIRVEVSTWEPRCMLACPRPFKVFNFERRQYASGPSNLVMHVSGIHVYLKTNSKMKQHHKQRHKSWWIPWEFQG